ncbi:glycosyltransferase [Oricola thermophila]|uniref:glycosyltransferase n=1 Tax=Oricola thermophila TaxID=2742145 RepID=UPI001FE76777|nr:glycosyltransferase [Oricola thermophila]
MSEFGRSLDDWGYVFLENGSEDETVAILDEFHRLHDKGIVETLPDLDSRIPVRTERLAHLRNRALEHVRADERLADFDYAIIMDMDGVNSLFPADRLRAHMSDWPEDRAAVFANQTESYYDVWAYRHPTHSPDDCWERVEKRPAGMSKAQAYETFVAARKKPWPRDAGMVEVESAFGGLALYRLPALRDCSYLGLDEDGNPRCEHVEFHRQIRSKGYRLFIDPAMINGTGAEEHKAPKGIRYLRRLLHRVGRLAGRR